MRLIALIVFLMLPWPAAMAQTTDSAPTAVVIIGVGTAHPSGVNNVFSDVAAIEMVWAPIDLRAIEIDRTRPLFQVRRDYCNPLALDRGSCPATDQQIQYSAYEVPAGVYMLQSITVSNSDLVEGGFAETEFFYPPDHLVFRNTLPQALEDPEIAKLLLAPGGVYYIGNFILDYEGKDPRIDRVVRNDPAALAAVQEQGGGDLTISFLDTAIAFFKGVAS